MRPWTADLDVQTARAHRADLPEPCCQRGYTASMTQRVGAKGQVVIPKGIRDELGLRPGTEVDFERDGATVRILPAGTTATAGLRGRYGSSGLAGALLADREREPR